MKMRLLPWLLVICLPSHAGPRFDQLRDVVGQKEASESVGSALRALKKHPDFESLFRSYALAKDSQSLQKSDMLHPRAILFGSDASLIVTFNADSSWEGGATLETVELNRQTRALEFREIIFKREFEPRQSLVSDDLVERERALQLAPSEIAYEDANTIVSTANPRKCLQCHQLDNAHPDVARYIWNQYSSWPSMYGSEDDSYFDKELATFPKFLVSTRENTVAATRYRNLDFSVLPPKYARGEAILALNRHAWRPNLRLTKLIAINQSEVYAQILKPSLVESGQLELAARLLCNFLRPDRKDTPLQILRAQENKLPRSLSLFRDEDHFAIGSPALPRGSLYMRDTLDWILTRDYVRSQPTLAAYLESYVREHVGKSLELASQSSRESDAFRGVDSDYLRYVAQYLHYADVTIAPELCRGLWQKLRDER